MTASLHRWALGWAVGSLTALLLTGCAANAGAPPTAAAAGGTAPPSPETPSASPTADGLMLETGDGLDLCEALPVDEVVPALESAGFSEPALVPSFAGTFPDDWPVCTLTSASGAVITVQLLPKPFATTIRAELGPAATVEADGTVTLPEQRAIAVAWGDDSTLTVTDESSSGAPATQRRLALVALEHLP